MNARLIRLTVEVIFKHSVFAERAVVVQQALGERPVCSQQSIPAESSTAVILFQRLPCETLSDALAEVRPPSGQFLVSAQIHFAGNNGFSVDSKVMNRNIEPR